MKKSFPSAIPLLACLAFTCEAQSMLPIPQSMTYQGELSENGAPKNGTVDVRFRIFDNVAGGFLYDSIVAEDIPVENGLFTARFTSNNLGFLAGGEYWLEIEVRDGALAGNGGFEKLSPRQPISSVPYSLNSDTVDGVDSVALLNQPGTSAFKTTGFTLVSVGDEGDAPLEFASVTVTAPSNGRFLVRARGTCGLPNSGQANRIQLAIAANANSAFPPGVSSPGDADMAQPANAGFHIADFSAEVAQPAVGGQPKSFKLFSRRTDGTGSSLCSGTLTAEFYPGTL